MQALCRIASRSCAQGCDAASQRRCKVAGDRPIGTTPKGRDLDVNVAVGRCGPLLHVTLVLLADFLYRRAPHRRKDDGRKLLKVPHVRCARHEEIQVGESVLEDGRLVSIEPEVQVPALGSERLQAMQASHLERAVALQAPHHNDTLARHKRKAPPPWIREGSTIFLHRPAEHALQSVVAIEAIETVDAFFLRVAGRSRREQLVRQHTELCLPAPEVREPNHH